MRSVYYAVLENYVSGALSREAEALVATSTANLFPPFADDAMMHCCSKWLGTFAGKSVFAFGLTGARKQHSGIIAGTAETQEEN